MGKNRTSPLLSKSIKVIENVWPKFAVSTTGQLGDPYPVSFIVTLEMAPSVAETPYDPVEHATGGGVTTVSIGKQIENLEDKPLYGNETLFQ